MGRRVHALEGPLTNPLISFSFLVASLAATIAIITALCGVRFRRKAASESETPEKGDALTQPSTITTAPLPETMASPAQQSEETDDTTSSDNKAQEMKELPLPPARQLRETYSCNNFSSARAMSKRNHSSSFSDKVSRSLSMAKLKDLKEEENKRKKGKFRSEDSLWTKTIILGEKCKVPDEEEAVIYDNKGNKISAYHPKAPNSMSMSRSNSYINQDAIPNQEKGKLREETKEDVDGDLTLVSSGDNNR